MVQMLDVEGDQRVSFEEFCRYLVVLPAAQVRYSTEEGGGWLGRGMRASKC